MTLSPSEKKEYDVLESAARSTYLSLRAARGKDITKCYLKLTQLLMPLRVSCSGGKYPIVEDVSDDAGNALSDDDDDDAGDHAGEDDQKTAAKKKRTKTPRVYSEFAFTSKLKALVSELKQIRDKDPSRKYTYWRLVVF